MPPTDPTRNAAKIELFYSPPPRSDSTASLLGKFHHQARRMPRILLFTTVVSTAFLFAILHLPQTRTTILRAVGAPPPTPHVRFLPTSLVGPRKHPHKYFGKGCSSSQFLDSVARARIRPDGASRTKGNVSDAPELSLPPFEYSFDLPGCPAPYIFSPGDACDLLSAFGGIFMRGDSFVRHVHTALMMLLRDRTDGALKETSHHNRCRADGMFDDRRECRGHLLDDTQDANEPVCDGSIYAVFLIAELENEHDLSPFYQWQDWLPAEKRMHSPVFYQASGIHYQYDVQTSVKYIQPVIDLAQRTFPGIINLWAGLHTPGDNIPEQYAESQGRETVLAYNQKISNILQFRSPGQLKQGSMKMVNWNNLTDGAASYDGAHYGYQVNMEKVQILLNLLDIVWGEIATTGGLVSFPPDIPRTVPPL